MENLVEERLSYDKHLRSVSDFTCGKNESLDNFLKSEAFQYNEDGQGNTYVIRFAQSNEIIAYYTLKANLIKAYNAEIEQDEHLPSVEIARLAVSDSLRRQGLGTYLFVKYILPKINNVKNIIGINTIMLFVEDYSSEDHNPQNFYKSLGFKLANEEITNHIENKYNEGCKLMYVNINNLDEFAQDLI